MKQKSLGVWIDYEALNKLNMSLTEYCVCSIINSLSNKSKYEYCLKSKSTIADHLNMSERNIAKIIRKLNLEGFLIRSDDGKYKTSDQWNDVFKDVSDYEQSSYPTMNKVPVNNEQSSQPTMNKVPVSNEQSSHYIINKENYIKNQPTNNIKLDGIFNEDQKSILSLPEIRNKYDKWFQFYPRREQNEKAYRTFLELKLYNGKYKELITSTRNYILLVANRPPDKIKMPVNFLIEFESGIRHR